MSRFTYLHPKYKWIRTPAEKRKVERLWTLGILIVAFAFFLLMQILFGNGLGYHCGNWFCE